MINEIFSQETKEVKQRYIKEIIKKEKDRSVLRILYQDNTYIVKTASSTNKSNKEIDCYKLLMELNVPTIKVIDIGEEVIVLEDLEYSNEYYLVSESQKELNLYSTGKQIAMWFNLFHQAGYEYFKNDRGRGFLESPFDLPTVEKISFTMKKLGMEDNRGLRKALGMVSNIVNLAKEQPYTFLFNDFYYGNLALSVNEDKPAIVYDYNFMRKGMAGTDYKIILASIGPLAQKGFQENYKYYNELECIIHAPLSKLIAFTIIGEKEEMPPWGENFINAINSINFEKELDKVKEYL